jgi:pimeloyl-ACP methyl ester carboxylesterase
MTAPFAVAPDLRVASPDGARLAVFAVNPAVAEAGPAAAEPAREERPRPAPTPLLLVHGTGSDHTTWRVAGPLLALHRSVHALDRRGRGASSDGATYAAGRELDDLAAVADALADRHGGPIAVFGHSLGGRLAIAATARTPAIALVVAYEGAPGRPGDPASRDHEILLDRLREDVARGDHDAALARFLAEGAGLPPDELAAFRSSDLWAGRAATASLIVREFDAALHDPAIGLDALGGVTVPVLQLAGSASPRWFRHGAASLHERLADGRLTVIDGARHGAHHGNASALVEAAEAFLDR